VTNFRLLLPSRLGRGAGDEGLSGREVSFLADVLVCHDELVHGDVHQPRIPPPALQGVARLGRPPTETLTMGFAPGAQGSRATKSKIGVRTTRVLTYKMPERKIPDFCRRWRVGETLTGMELNS